MMTSTAPTLVDVSPELLEEWLANGEAVLIDVRENVEHAAERIPAAKHIPLGTLDPEALRAEHGVLRVVFHCRGGGRSSKAAAKYSIGDEPVYHLAGGLSGWKDSGRAVARPRGKQPLDIMRQVQLTAGALVLAGTLLGAFVSPSFLLLSGFVGGGLMFSGASGSCGMARVLGVMPWNRVSTQSCSITP